MDQNTGRNSTLGSALAILVLALIIIAVIAYIVMNPDILKSLAYLVIAVIAIIIVIVVIVYLAAAFLALPYYAAKGETYQTGKAYDLDDIEPVKEKDSREKK